MVDINREFKESPTIQGVDEIVAYTLTTTPWGSTPTGIVVTVFSVLNSTLTDVTSTVMPTNTPVAVGDVITLSALKLLTADTKYHIDILFVCSGNTFVAHGTILAEL